MSSRAISHNQLGEAFLGRLRYLACQGVDTRQRYMRFNQFIMLFHDFFEHVVLTRKELLEQFPSLGLHANKYAGTSLFWSSSVRDIVLGGGPHFSKTTQDNGEL